MLKLRTLLKADLDILFAFQCDHTAMQLAAFTPRDATSRDAFDTHWERILGDPDVSVRVMTADSVVVGYVASFLREGVPEVTYWIGREYWGQGIATKALGEFLGIITARPMFARVARDNRASIRVLEKNGFSVIGHETSYANARETEIEELILRLDAPPGGELILKDATEAQLATFSQLEHDHAEYVTPESVAQHTASFRDPTVIYKSIEADGAFVGHLILVLDPDGASVEVKRIVIGPAGQGYGKRVMAMIHDIVRDEIARERIWLDVLDTNTRAQHVYEQCGFAYFGETVIEGRRFLLMERKVSG